MALALIPDAEKLIGGHLRAHADLVALSARVVGKTPDDKSTAWIRLTEVLAPEDSTLPVDHLPTFLLQLDCYAGEDGGQPEAKLLGRTVRAVLKDAPAQSFADAVVTRVKIANSQRVPDTDGFEPARERVIVSAFVTIHPS